MSSVTLPRRAVALALAAAMSVVVACSSDDGPPLADPQSTRPSTSTTAPVATAPSSPATTASAPPSSVVTAPTPVDLAALRPPFAANDPAALAAQITAAERTIRDPAAEDVAVGNAALAQQVAYRQLGRHPEWDAAVLGAVPPEVNFSVSRNILARREFEAMHTRRSSTLPAWQIVAPEPVDLLLSTYQEAAAAFGLPWPYLAAIHLVETGTGRIRGLSSAGAQGPMQFLPSTWAAYGDGGDINDTRDAIFGAARYLAANGGATNMANALWNYNHSDHYVRGITFYAEAIIDHPLALRGYHHWGIWYVTSAGDAYLPIGYTQPSPVDAVAYLAVRPPFGA